MVNLWYFSVLIKPSTAYEYDKMEDWAWNGGMFTTENEDSSNYQKYGLHQPKQDWNIWAVDVNKQKYVFGQQS